MAASSLLRLVIVVLILITLALTSSMAWGALDDVRDGAVSIESIQAPAWLDSERVE